MSIHIVNTGQIETHGHFNVRSILKRRRNMPQHPLACFALGVLTVVSLGAVSLSNEGVIFPDGTVQTTAAPSDFRRAFYLTMDQFTGDQADGAGVCADGFHFASVWEILDVSSLRWDTARGPSNLDSGEGPPVDWYGWVRTGDGYPDVVTSGTGKANCFMSVPWDTDSPSFDGTWIALPAADDLAWSATPTRISPWVAGVAPCDEQLGVWCVEDSPGAASPS
jgi:hypothetical protein